MGALRGLYRKWASGFVDQSRTQADADIVAEYECVSREFGPDSEEAAELRPHAELVYERRREEIARDCLLERKQEK